MNQTTGLDTFITVLQIITPLIVGLLMFTLKNLTSAIKELKVLIETIQRDFNSMVTEVALLKRDNEAIKQRMSEIEKESEKQDSSIRTHQEILTQIKNAHNNSNCSVIKIS